MQANFTLNLNHMLKKSIICLLMIGGVVLALASSGGGNKKKSNTFLGSGFTPIRTTNGFTLKAGPSYSGSHTFTNRNHSVVLYNTVLTYQKGNTIFILPYQVRMTHKTSYKSNLNLLTLKVKLRK